MADPALLYEPIGRCWRTSVMPWQIPTSERNHTVDIDDVEKEERRLEGEEPLRMLCTSPKKADTGLREMFLFKVIRTRLVQSRVSTSLVVEFDVVFDPSFCLLWRSVCFSV
jgi:hypothetical protein